MFIIPVIVDGRSTGRGGGVVSQASPLPSACAAESGLAHETRGGEYRNGDHCWRCLVFVYILERMQVY